MKLNLQDRRILITGGGTGIGRVLAESAAREGASVFVTGRRPGPLAETVGSILSLSPGVQAGFFPLDLTSPGAPTRLVAEALHFLGGLDALVVNAGFGEKRPLEKFDEKTIDESIALNLTAAIKTTHAALAALEKAAQDRPGADLILLASTAALQGFSGGSIYCATKWGVRGFGKALQEELKPKNIRVTIVCPGSTDTAFFDRFPAGIPRAEMLRPAEVAAAIIHVLSARPEVLFEELILRPRVVKS
jgi:NAD(P)-dependent dehydrogenase (short-subunit alcohol dehydrogenase family)